MPITIENSIRINASTIACLLDLVCDSVRNQIDHTPDSKRNHVTFVVSLYDTFPGFPQESLHGVDFKHYGIH